MLQSINAICVFGSINERISPLRFFPADQGLVVGEIYLLTTQGQYGIGSGCLGCWQRQTR